MFKSLFAIFGVLFISIPSFADPAKPSGGWVNISDPTIKKLKEENKKIDWPFESAGITVDPSTGDVYMIVPGQGLWKSSDRGTTFARCDEGKIGGRCETSYSLNFDAAGGRLACFMLDGKAGISLDAGKTWRSFKDVGRNWDYAAVNWSQDEPKNIFAARHESGGEMYTSTDGGASWTQIDKDPKYDAVGIFDEKTLVTTKGDGVLRSTDAGKTWAKVSDAQPVGHVVRVYKGVAYWLAKDGMIVSRDKGATWSKMGSAVDATVGPLFADEKHLVAAGKKGIFETTDAGETWKLVAPLPEGHELSKPGWFTNIAWDPIHDVFYASRMGKPAYKLERRS